MLRSVWDPEVQAVLDGAKSGRPRQILFNGELLDVPPPTPSPEDWRDRWMYLVLTDRFCDPQRRRPEPPYDVVCHSFRGGTWQGIIDRLPYLKQLGVSALWLSPVLKNTCQIDGTDDGSEYHGYCTQNFLAVESRFATDAKRPEAELRRLVDEAHRHGMLVVLDIAVTYAGDVFAYNGACSQMPWSERQYPILWRDENGYPHPGWTEGAAIVDPPDDATIFPDELRRNPAFRRQGTFKDNSANNGDLDALKQLLLSDPDTLDAQIRAYQFIIAKYDVDAFRIDAIKHIGLDAARIFSNAIREFCLEIGKKNFFIFGEVWSGNEEDISVFIGRDPGRPAEPIGIDAAPDYPLYFTLFAADGVATGQTKPADLVSMYERRKTCEEGRVASHAEATSFFVTFMDNHDRPRFFQGLAGDPRGVVRGTLALTCLFTLQGIPCVYYGTEQGLSGCLPPPASDANFDSAVSREPLWEKPGAFATDHPLFIAISALGRLRQEHPALRYGRQYFRQLSGDGATFGYSTFAPGVLAFSRILGDTEVLIVANTNPELAQTVSVLVDSSLNPIGSAYELLYSNCAASAVPGAVEESGEPVTLVDLNLATSSGFCRSVRVTLQPAEAQVLARRPPGRSPTAR